MGTLYGLTPFRRNFIDYVKCDVPVKDVTNINRSIGIGNTPHKLINSNGKDVFIPYVSYHITQNGIILFSPKTYHHVHGCYSEVYDSQVSMYLTDNIIHITIYKGKINTPIVYNYFVSDNEKRLNGP